MINRSLDTPIWQLTIGEFLSLIENKDSQLEPTRADFTGEQYVYGISGIAKLFGCSRATAQKIKDSGKIDKAVTQTGRKIIVDAALAIELVKTSKR